MEPEELRKLRVAHRLTPGELAEMLGVSSDDILGREAAISSPYHVPIQADIRRRILRQLALFRERHKERNLVVVARTGARRFSAQPFVRYLPTTRGSSRDTGSPERRLLELVTSCASA